MVVIMVNKIYTPHTPLKKKKFEYYGACYTKDLTVIIIPPYQNDLWSQAC